MPYLCFVLMNNADMLHLNFEDIVKTAIKKKAEHFFK